jgi:ribosomal protein S27AE
MDLHMRDAAKRQHTRLQIGCAQCGESLFMPEWSELVGESRVRHLWQCDTCGYAFETTVQFAAAA